MGSGEAPALGAQANSFANAESDRENKIDISVDSRQNCTAVSFTREVGDMGARRSVVGDVISAFDDLSVSVVKTRVETSDDFVEKHLYHVQDVALKKALNDEKSQRLREVPSLLLAAAQQQALLSGEQCIVAVGEGTDHD